MTIVIFITVLIWVWADLAIKDEFAFQNAVIKVASSTGPNMWISFDGEPSATVKRVVFAGPASRIAEARRSFEAGSLGGEFYYSPSADEVTIPAYKLSVYEFFRRNERIKQLGLTVQSCDPNVLGVRAVRLARKTVKIRCVDENGNPLRNAIVDPVQIEMAVPESWEGDKLVAEVRLSRIEREQSRAVSLENRPYVEFGPGQVREGASVVRVVSSPDETRLDDYTITAVTAGFTLSANLQGKYRVEVLNPDAMMRTISIRATAEAKRAYESMRYQVMLEIYDSDIEVREGEPLRRAIVYNFPDEYVRRDEIILKQQPVEVKFRLVPMDSGQARPVGGE